MYYYYIVCPIDCTSVSVYCQVLCSVPFDIYLPNCDLILWANRLGSAWVLYFHTVHWAKSAVWRTAPRTHSKTFFFVGGGIHFLFLDCRKFLSFSFSYRVFLLKIFIMGDYLRRCWSISFHLQMRRESGFQIKCLVLQCEGLILDMRHSNDTVCWAEKSTEKIHCEMVWLHYKDNFFWHPVSLFKKLTVFFSSKLRLWFICRKKISYCQMDLRF